MPFDVNKIYLKQSTPLAADNSEIVLIGLLLKCRQPRVCPPKACSDKASNTARCWMEIISRFKLKSASSNIVFIIYQAYILHPTILNDVGPICCRSNPEYYKQLLDEIFVICRIINVEVRVISRAEGEADNSFRDVDNFAYHKNRVQ